LVVGIAVVLLGLPMLQTGFIALLSETLQFMRADRDWLINGRTRRSRTDRARQAARGCAQKGQVARSRDLSAAAVTLAGGLGLFAGQLFGGRILK
jgi:hypothetical protein